MTIRYYNTLTKQKDEFVPVTPGKVGLYTCGPTVYNFAHIGNLRTFLFEDLLRRHLTYRGYDVTHVMNLTDVEDKIIRTCRETGESLESLTARYTEAFFDDLAALRIQRAHHCPVATKHIGEIVKLIERLRDRGHTYERDGSIYFRLSTMPNYGRLSGFDMEQLQDGASGRVDRDEYSTDDARDFALWKAYVEDDGDIYWETPLGKGRPGWHIECSAMSMAYLGETFDIHCGAVDLVFPHHENEIAQAECATGKPFVNYWIHAAHLNISGQKISKSLGNSITLRSLLEQGHDPVAIRWALGATHYRQPSNFTDDALVAAKQSLDRVQEFRRRLTDVVGDGADLHEETAECERLFGEALDDDLNISAALAAVFDFIRDTNKQIDGGALGSVGAQAAQGLFERLDAASGLFPPVEADETPQWVLAKVKERQEARSARDFARADALRDELRPAGWAIKDTPDGAKVQKA